MSIRNKLRNWLLITPKDAPNMLGHPIMTTSDSARQTMEHYGTGDLAVIVLRIDNGYILRVTNGDGMRGDVVYAADEASIGEQLVAVYARRKMLSADRTMGGDPNKSALRTAGAPGGTYTTGPGTVTVSGIGRRP